MSLDFSLHEAKNTPCPHCKKNIITRGDEVFTRNITHNLVPLAEAVGIYKALWRPKENGFVHAHQLILPLKEALNALTGSPKQFKKYNPSNGWGSYESFITSVAACLEACAINPDAFIETSV